MPEIKDDIAQLHNKAEQPKGVLPKHIQAWVGCGLAIVMIAILLLTPSTPPSKKSGGRSTAEDVPRPNTDVKRWIEAEQQRLRAEQDRVEAEKTAIALRKQSVADGLGDPHPGAPRPIAYNAADAGEGLAEEIRREDRRRDYQSRFASVVALSLRGATQGKAAEKPPTLRSVRDEDVPPVPAQVASVSTPAAARGPLKTGDVGPATPDVGLNRSVGPLHRVFQGKWIESVLTNQLDGTFSGPVNCMVTTAIYSQDGQHVLIPQGSRVLGEAQQVDSLGQRRLAVVFHRLIMPDGYSVSLDRFKGLNQIGETGLRDRVNNHYLQLFGVSIAIGAIGGFSQINTRYAGGDVSGTDAYRQGVASSVSQSALHILDRFLNVLPTITIRAGHRVKVYLADDLLLPAYDGHRMAADL